MKCDKCGCEKPDPVPCLCPFPGGWPLAPEADRGTSASWAMPPLYGYPQCNLVYDSRPGTIGWTVWRGYNALGRDPGARRITEQQAVDLLRLAVAMRAVLEPEPA